MAMMTFELLSAIRKATHYMTTVFNPLKNEIFGNKSYLFASVTVYVRMVKDSTYIQRKENILSPREYPSIS